MMVFPVFEFIGKNKFGGKPTWGRISRNEIMPLGNNTLYNRISASVLSTLTKYREF